jgi:hypothetical protein
MIQEATKRHQILKLIQVDIENVCMDKLISTPINLIHSETQSLPGQYAFAAIDSQNKGTTFSIARVTKTGVAARLKPSALGDPPDNKTKGSVALPAMMAVEMARIINGSRNPTQIERIVPSGETAYFLANLFI